MHAQNLPISANLESMCAHNFFTFFAFFFYFCIKRWYANNLSNKINTLLNIPITKGEKISTKLSILENLDSGPFVMLCTMLKVKATNARGVWRPAGRFHYKLIGPKWPKNL